MPLSFIVAALPAVALSVLAVPAIAAAAGSTPGKAIKPARVLMRSAVRIPVSRPLAPVGRSALPVASTPSMATEESTGGTTIETAELPGAETLESGADAKAPATQVAAGGTSSGDGTNDAADMEQAIANDTSGETTSAGADGMPAPSAAAQAKPRNCRRNAAARTVLALLLGETKLKDAARDQLDACR